MGWLYFLQTIFDPHSLYTAELPVFTRKSEPQKRGTIGSIIGCKRSFTESFLHTARLTNIFLFQLLMPARAVDSEDRL